MAFWLDNVRYGERSGGYESSGHTNADAHEALPRTKKLLHCWVRFRFLKADSQPAFC